eukprot:GHVN01022902.1.p2 GENE.GHVN01022902.1~~GHVN01022902.1.p2  ORF type:complete len:108 (+),score=5.73 GHVN01022902.1:516-839(+)
MVEDKVAKAFLPNLLGRQISETERELLALPPQHGGTGVAKVNENTHWPYMWSQASTQYLRLINVRTTKPDWGQHEATIATVFKDLRQLRISSRHHLGNDWPLRNNVP